jgi:hypothetical protein
MTLRVFALAVDCHDPDTMAGWWAEVLRYSVGGAVPGEAWIEDSTGTHDGILFLKVPEAKSVKNRLHLDLRPSRTRDEEVERVKGLGAKVLEGFGGPEATWIVLQDPEGNEFCILRGPEDPIPPGGEPVEA